MEQNITQRFSAGKIVLFVVLGVLVMLVFWIVATYNTLIRMRENIKTQQANVEVQYQRRFDLFSNLEGAVKGILAQEQTVFGDIAEARSKYSGAQSGTPEKVEAANKLDGALGRLLVIMENYPQLRSVESVTRLQDEIAGTENRIGVERSRYNDTVNVFNQKIQFFPSSIIAGMFGFVEFPRFEVQVQEAKIAPKIDLEVK